MKIGIISDTHDNLGKIKHGVDFFNSSKVEVVLHAGDFVSPFTARVFGDLECKLIGVFGNNDGEKFGLRSAFEQFKIGEIYERHHELTLEKRRIIIMHYPTFIDILAESGKYDVIIYGHTHKVDIQRRKGLVINPGAGSGYLSGKATVGILDLDTLEIEIVEI